MSQDTLANDPHSLDSLRAQLDRADAERNRRLKNIQRQRDLLGLNDHARLQAAQITSEGTLSARRINEALRPKAPSQAPSASTPITSDPYRLEDGIPVLRMVNSRFERTSAEPVPFETIARVSAKRFEQPAIEKTDLRRLHAYRAAGDAIAVDRQNSKKQKRPLTTGQRLQHWADHHLFSGQRPAIALVTAAFLGAALGVIAFYFQHAGA